LHAGGEGFEPLTVHNVKELLFNMNYFVYILYNEKNDKFYIGQTNDIERRLTEHNSGETNYTSKYSGEWRVVYKEEFVDRTGAIKRERFLKNQKNKNFYKKLCNLI
jgi:putative endonuclease